MGQILVTPTVHMLVGDMRPRDDNPGAGIRGRVRVDQRTQGDQVSKSPENGGILLRIPRVGLRGGKILSPLEFHL